MSPSIPSSSGNAPSSPHPPPPHHPHNNMFHILWETRAYRIYIILLVYISGAMLMLPVLPTLVTNDFAARRHKGVPIHCEEYSPSEAPPACQNAHSDVVLWSTWSGFFQNTFLSVILTPALGSWSDVHGRKPFLLLAQGLACLPYTIVILHLHTGLPLYWMYIIQTFTSSVTTIAPSLAYIADIVPPVHRGACFGLILASFSIAVIVGPPLGALLPPAVVPLVTIVVILVCMVATQVVLPESLSSRSAATALHLNTTSSPSKNNSSSTSTIFTTVNPWRSMAILRRSPLFIRLTAVLMVGAVVSEGLSDILIQYLQIKLNFIAVDVSHVFMAFGICALLVQGVFLRLLLRTFGERWLLVVGLVAGGCQQLALAFVHRKWQVLAAVSLGSLGSVTFPTISSIKANAADDHEQGRVQGALYGAKSLASGVGPLAFAGLFSLFSRTDSPIGIYFPGAPFILGAVLMAATTVLACGLPLIGSGGGDSERVYSAVDVVDDDVVDVEGRGGLLSPPPSSSRGERYK